MSDCSGGCACGAVRWYHTGAHIRHLVCHCESCRRATSSGFAAFLGTRRENVDWSGAVTEFKSSDDGARGFCRDCGTRLYFKSDRWPGELHLHVGTMDDPAPYHPDSHVVLDEKLDWITLGDQVSTCESFKKTPALKPNEGANV